LKDGNFDPPPSDLLGMLTNPEPEHEEQEALTPTEEKILRYFVQLDGRMAPLMNITSSIGVSKIVSEQAVENLMDRGYLDWDENPFGYREYGLTKEGRALVVSMGFA